MFQIESNLQVIFWHEESYSITVHMYLCASWTFRNNKVDFIFQNNFDPSYARSWSGQIGCSYVLSAISYQELLKTKICLSVSIVSTGTPVELKYNKL